LLACLAGVPLASAQAPDPGARAAQDKARAMAKFEEGSRAFDQKRFKDAIDLFLEADLIIQHPAFAYNASLAYEAMGDVAAALKWAREYLYRSPAADDKAQVEASIKRFELRLREKGVQQVTVRSTPAGATVLVDGAPVGVTPWTGEIAPGAHALELRRRGSADKTQSFEVAPDRALLVELTLEAKSEAPGPTAPTSPPVASAAANGGVRGRYAMARAQRAQRNAERARRTC
jgi:tetratricopeptide (TPR) repeat protein